MVKALWEDTILKEVENCFLMDDAMACIETSCSEFLKREMQRDELRIHRGKERIALHIRHDHAMQDYDIFRGMDELLVNIKFLLYALNSKV